MTATQLFIERLRAELPPIFPRKTASRLIGGAIAIGTFANMDCRGEGPGAVLMGKSVVYEREAFLSWLEQRFAEQLGTAPRPVKDLIMPLDAPAEAVPPVVETKRGRGRPRGSKNKPKACAKAAESGEGGQA